MTRSLHAVRPSSRRVRRSEGKRICGAIPMSLRMTNAEGYDRNWGADMPLHD